MNIFWLDANPERAARAHYDKHVVKMPTEYAQMLCNGVHESVSPYRRAYLHHPCSKWVLQSSIHWHKLMNLAVAVGAEYTVRYGKMHKATEVALTLRDLVAKRPELLVVARNNPILPPLAVPSQYQRKTLTMQDVVSSYRAYYLGEKSHLRANKTEQFPAWQQVMPPTV